MGLTDRAFHLRISTPLRGRLTDPALPLARRESCAVVVRRMADTIKRLDPLFCYEWFYGLCGLDHWGDLMALDSIEAQPVTSGD